MKTMQELYSEIVASDELKKAIVEAMKANELEDFLKAHGCEATEEEIQEFIEAKAAEDTPIELSDEERAALQRSADTLKAVLRNVLEEE